jgi:4-aminobutyrate---pyruvate transaminase
MSIQEQEQRRLRAADRAHYVHSNTDLDKHLKEGPTVFTRGQGIHIFDAAGRAYIEGVSGLWCVGLGFDERRLADAAYRQMTTLPYYHNFQGRTPDTTIRLAERLAGLAPAGLRRVLFATSGSEANDTAVKLAWYYHNALDKPRKKKIVARCFGYHGVTIASGSMTHLAAINGGFDLPVGGFIHTACPDHLRFAQPGESQEQFASRLAAELDALIVAEGPDTVAAFIAEPIMGVGGVIVPPNTYFPKIQAVLRKHDVLLIADEVICGFGRTGKMFGSELFGIEPDFMSVGKQLTSAYFPLSALFMNERVFDVVRAESGRRGTFGHGFTYSGHPVGAAVALEVLDIYAERKILEHVCDVGSVLHARLASLREHPLVAQVRGVGMLAAVQLAASREPLSFFDPSLGVGRRLVAHAKDAGLILRVLQNDTVAIAPPLIATSTQVHDIVDIFEAALARVASEVWPPSTARVVV